MSKTITIEGSILPSADLARGERATVRDDDERVQALIAGGYVNVVSEHDELLTFTDPNAKTEETPVTEAPSRSGPGSSRDDWAEFLAKHPAGFVTEGKDRTALLADWDAWVASSQNTDDAKNDSSE